VKRRKRRIRLRINAEVNAVFACSALKKAYRDRFRVSEDVYFVFLRGSRARIAAQLQERREHFVDPAILGSQFDDLEEPRPPEAALTFGLTDNIHELVAQIRTKLRR